MGVALGDGQDPHGFPAVQHPQHLPLVIGARDIVTGVVDSPQYAALLCVPERSYFRLVAKVLVGVAGGAGLIAPPARPGLCNLSYRSALEGLTKSIRFSAHRPMSHVDALLEQEFPHGSTAGERRSMECD